MKKFNSMLTVMLGLLLIVPVCADWPRHILHPYLPSAAIVDAANVVGDRGMEVIASGWSSGELVLIEEAPVGWNYHQLDTRVPGVKGVCIADFNHDLKNDIAAVTDKGLVVWYENQHPQWKRRTIDLNQGGWQRIRAADMDRDGKMDLIASNKDADALVLFKNLGDNRWKKQYIDDSISKPIGFCIADIDRDGDLDIAAVSNGKSQVYLYENIPDDQDSPRFYRSVVDDELLDPWSVAIADINMDSYPDIISQSGEAGRLVWYQNMLDLRWKKWMIDNSLAGPRTVCAGDLDNDGAMDVLVSCSEEDAIYRYEYKEMRWNKYTVATHLDGAHYLCGRDINLDGNPDVLATGWNGNKVVWYENVEKPEIQEPESMVLAGDVKVTNYPNPFNPLSRIMISVPVASSFSISVYNVTGQRLEQLHDGTLPAGTHEFLFDGNEYPAGIYLYTVRSGSQKICGKMMLLK